MKDIVRKLLYVHIREGILEKIYIKLVFKVKNISDISAFWNEVPENQFEIHYEKYLPQLFKSKISEEIQTKIIHCFCLNYFGDEKQEYERIYQEILDAFEKIDTKAYSVNRWRTLNQFFICHGMFQVADICRTNAKEKVLTSNKQWGNEWRKAVVCLEERELDKAGCLIKRIEENFWFKTFFSKEVYSLKLYYQLLVDGVLENPKFFGEKEQEFGKIVKDKEILIIGPAPLQKGFPFEERNYITIRNNELREDIEEYKEERVTDIIYYNGEIAKRVQELKTAEFFGKFKFIVLKNRCVWHKNIQHVRKTLAMDEVIFDGDLNVLPIMIMDLWQFGIKSLYVCGNNLYLSRVLYAKGYVGTKYVRKKYNNWNSFSLHNMFSQHFILKNLYLSKKIIPDEELEYVLKLNSREYAKQMEEIHVADKRRVNFDSAKS